MKLVAQNPHPLPVENNRIITVDVLRGFALFGILYAHMIFWYTGGPLPEAIYRSFSDIPSGIAIGFLMIFFSAKFFSLFSFLFGLSFYIQIKSLAKNNENVALRFGWRLFILGIIGLIHHAIWRADILSIYVPLGFLLIFARHLSNKTLLIIGALFVLNIPTKLIEFFSLIIQHKVEFIHVDNKLEGEAYYQIVKHGSFMETVWHNIVAMKAKYIYQITSGRLFITFGFFLLGMLAGRMQWFERQQESHAFFKNVWKKTGLILLATIVVGIIIGVLIGALSINMQEQPWGIWASGFLLEIFNTSLTIFYIASITLLMQKDTWQRRLAPLANIGKMALTSYLTQTFFGLMLFFSFGFGLFELTSPALNVVICIVIFTLQIYFSRWWLSLFNYGPIEWLWRSGTFLKWQPFLKK